VPRWVGIATSGAVVIGKVYIVQYDTLSIPYEYSTIAVFECNLTVIDMKKEDN
jgi:hypothetical protein